MTLAYGVRFTAGLPFAAGLSIFLVLLMRALITVEARPPQPAAEDIKLDFLSVLVDTDPYIPPPTKDDVADPPPPPTLPTSKVVTEPPTTSNPGGPIKPWSSAGENVDTVDPIIKVPLTPIYRPAHDYPRIAIQRGLEGWCNIVFDITTGGTTTNVRVERCSDDAFERAGVRAVEAYRYTPQDAADGPIVRRNELIQLEWRITE